MNRQPARSGADSSRVIPPRRYIAQPNAKTRRLGSQGPHLGPRKDALPIPSGAVLCLFLDRNGREREVWLDCKPARFTRLELATGPKTGMLRRTWILMAQPDDKGRALYLEKAPEKY